MNALAFRWSVYSSESLFMNKRIEIGSEFWDAPLSDNADDCLNENTQFVLSGRTALELAARDLIAERKMRSICLPAYCCDSMISPFARLGVKIRFYDVRVSKDGAWRILSADHGCDAVLLLDYFGFCQSETAEIAERERRRGTAVILDQVQSYFSSSDAVLYADYTVMSWRKWFFSCAAAATKKHGKWAVHPSRPAGEKYVDLRKTAAKQKERYLKTGLGDKETFLDGFAQAEELLDVDFSDYAAEEKSVDVIRKINVPFLKKRRRENAKVIYEEIQRLCDDRIRPLFTRLGKTDTPLFVPVLVNPSYRTDLRQFLINNQVYCPIHWADAKTGGGEGFYTQELSLVCDQRYTIEDVKREMNLIKEYFIHYV